MHPLLRRAHYIRGARPERQRGGTAPLTWPKGCRVRTPRAQHCGVARSLHNSAAADLHVSHGSAVPLLRAALASGNLRAVDCPMPAGWSALIACAAPALNSQRGGAAPLTFRSGASYVLRAPYHGMIES